MADEITPVLVPGTGYIYVATVGTEAPELVANFDPKDPSKWGEEVKTLWKSIGNTSLDNGIEMASEGDEPEVLGSWQSKSLKTTNPAKKYSVTINLEDFTAESFKLYYGTSKGLTDAGLFEIPTNPAAQDRALLIVAVDGEKACVWHYPKVSIIGADAISIDPAALSEMPVKATVVAKDQSTPLGTVSPVFELAKGVKPTP
ncbi:phage tail tube protein [Kitasatospora purpeofusca]|uniref:phage tail tube protein n=1 Tax=Kitasatospora purpeofusca TaxID=67352 RepID=UPI0036B9C981